MPCVARPGASLARHGGTADAAWVSLLTVRAILAQVKLSFFRSTISQHRDFHNGAVAGDLGCGKIETRRSPPGGRLPPGVGKPHGGARTHLVDEPVDNELRFSGRRGRLGPELG
jgi:hypothetical protein